MHELKIIFPTEEARRLFAIWLADCGGDQGYFQVMKDSKTPSLRFGYHGPEDQQYPRNDRRRYGEFLCDNTIRVEICKD